MSNFARTMLAILIFFGVIALGILWTAYQWNVCMDEIGNFWYCVQHISN